MNNSYFCAERLSQTFHKPQATCLTGCSQRRQPVSTWVLQISCTLSIIASYTPQNLMKVRRAATHSSRHRTILTRPVLSIALELGSVRTIWSYVWHMDSVSRNCSHLMRLQYLQQGVRFGLELILKRPLTFAFVPSKVYIMPLCGLTCLHFSIFLPNGSYSKPLSLEEESFRLSLSLVSTPTNIKPLSSNHHLASSLIWMWTQYDFYVSN